VVWAFLCWFSICVKFFTRRSFLSLIISIFSRSFSITLYDISISSFISMLDYFLRFDIFISISLRVFLSFALHFISIFSPFSSREFRCSVALHFLDYDFMRAFSDWLIFFSLSDFSDVMLICRLISCFFFFAIDFFFAFFDVDAI